MQSSSSSPILPPNGATASSGVGSSNDHNHQKVKFFTARIKDLLKERQQVKQTNKLAVASENPVEIEMYYFSPDKLERKISTNAEDISPEAPEWATVVWLNIDGISESILKKLSEGFELHALALEDVVEIQHRPKLNFFGDTLFMVTSIINKIITSGKSILETEQVSFFLVGKTLITIQQGLPGDVWGEVRTSLEDENSLVRNSDTGFLLYALLAGIVDTCKPILDELDDALEDLEVAMMENPSHGLNKKVYAVKRHQITLRSVLLPTRKIMLKLAPEDSNEGDDPSLSTPLGSSSVATTRSTRGVQKKGSRVLSQVTNTYFRDLLGVLTHLCEQIDQQKEVAASLSSLYSEHQAQRQGTASFAIAIVSVFFLPLTFVAGVYGMNFDIMPELRWEKGYLYVWMVFIGIVLFEVFIFRAVGWLEFRVSKRVAHLLKLRPKAGTLPPKYSRGTSLIAADSDSMSETF